MFTSYTPAVGEWYVKNTGKLIKVRMLSYFEEKIERVVIEFLDGTIQKLSFNEWCTLDLNKRISDASRSIVLR
ncbi:hypothetical protein JYT31_01095 [Beggiatoa alba]|nr:hypothetical protein [Beggiatoa alba]